MDDRDTKGDRRHLGAGLAEVTQVLDVGPSSTAARDEENADLAVFVDRIAAAGSDAATAAARTAARTAIAAGAAPPGLRRLAEGLAASVAATPPLPRHPGEDSGSIVAAVRSDALVVLDGFAPDELAGAVAALVADGRRVVVTAPTADDLTAIRDELPGEAYGRSLDRMPVLTPAELRELRRLVATSTPVRRARGQQELPPADALPAVAEVAALCASAAQAVDAASTRGGVVPTLMAELAPDRREAVISVARCVNRSLGALHPRSRWDWAWSLLADLIYGQDRTVFDRMLEDTAQAVAALRSTKGAARAEIVGPLSPDALDLLYRFRDFLDSGGRSRSYFRSPAQREVQPVLRLLRVDGHPPETFAEVNRAIEHLELGQRLAKVDAGCEELAISSPMGEDDLQELADGLVKVGAAARSVGALRHDVLFIAEHSPLSVPDAESAEAVAADILDYAEHGSGAEAGAELDAMADEVATLAPTIAISAEHERAITALRERDVAAYAAAVDALGAARRDAHDAARENALMDKLAEGSPMLADAWGRHGRANALGLGFACFQPVEELLGAVPPPDSADVVVVAGAAELGVERLLLGTVAPRMVAVIAPDDRADSSPSLLSVLQRASALVIRGRTEPPTSGRVLRLDPGERRGGVSGAAAVG